MTRDGLKPEQVGSLRRLLLRRWRSNGCASAGHRLGRCAQLGDAASLLLGGCKTEADVVALKLEAIEPCCRRAQEVTRFLTVLLSEAMGPARKASRATRHCSPWCGLGAELRRT